MTREKLQEIINEFSDNSSLNYLSANSGANTSAEDANVNNYAKNNLQNKGANPEMFKQENFGIHEGMRFFGRPIFSIASADNPGFLDIKRPEVVGEHHFLPHDWMSDAKSVISVFLPYSRSTVDANKTDDAVPAIEWLYTRVDGQRFLLALGAMIRDVLIADGCKAVTPYTEDKFIMQVSTSPAPGTEHVPPYSTNWSERHVGYVTGLGTFGLSTNFISKAGCAGRLISIVTDWDVEPDERDYDDWLGYCNRCGSCILRCQAKAHYSDKPLKDHARCSAYMGKVCQPFQPRYGCGKCQSGIPCEYTPMRAK